MKSEEIQGKYLKNFNFNGLIKDEPTKEKEKVHIKKKIKKETMSNVKIVLYQVNQGDRVFRDEDQGQLYQMLLKVNIKLIIINV